MDPFDLRLWPSFPLHAEAPATIDQVAIDSRRVDSSHALFVALRGVKEDGHAYVGHAARLGAKYALVAQDWQPTEELGDLTLLRVPNPLKALQEIAKTYRQQLPTTLIGLGGSFGKTMLKDLLHTILSFEKSTGASPESFNSQIGVPLSLFTLNQRHEVALIEAAVSYPNEMDVLADLIRPDCTIITPLGKKHLATLGSLEVLQNEISKLVLATSSKGWALLPSNLSSSFPIPCPYECWHASSDAMPHAQLAQAEDGTPSRYTIRFPDGYEYQGHMTAGYTYFLSLVNMAIKAAWKLGIRSSTICQALDRYQPEPMRTEMWKSGAGTIWIQDVYSADPQSVDRSLRHFDYAQPGYKRTFVFGGLRGNGPHLDNDYRRIGKSLQKSQIDRLILFGDKNFHSLAAELESHPHLEVLSCPNEHEAFDYLQQHPHPQEIILIKGDKKFGLDQLTQIFQDSIHTNQCFINLAAVAANLTSIRQLLPSQTRVMVMVKALAYGTDHVQMTKFLAKQGVDIVGVSYIDEGIALKCAGAKQAIFSLNAAPYEAAKAIKWDLEIGVSDQLLIQALAEEGGKQKKQVKVHLHVNTGMGRFGCRPEEALELARLIHQSPSLQLEGIMTHFACSEDPQQDHFTRQQVQIFDQTIQSIEDAGISIKWRHAANSAAAMRFHLPQYNMVRIGLAIYGLYGSEAMRQALDLRLALSLTSRIVNLTICRQGETISYGRRYTVNRETQKIAVLPIGYFDGLHRHYSGKFHLLIRGQKAPLVGTICMDYMMVDVTDIPHVSVGDKALIFGEDEFGNYVSPEEVAAQGDSIIHELITCLGPRIQRIFIEEEGPQVR